MPAGKTKLFPKLFFLNSAKRLNNITQCNGMHPSKGIQYTKSRILEGKKIILGITGSIAAVQAFELSRELMRHGADVHVVMTDDAEKFITATSMHFATGNEVTTEIDGRTQHVEFLGEYEGQADLLLISPCTSNTISKIAAGICDTSVTTMACVALGTKVPVMIVPAMNLAMYENPAVQRNVEFLKEAGVSFVGPNISGKKAKNADFKEITEAVIIKLEKNKLKGKKVLVIGGASREMIDDVRVISNISSGETALELALAARRQGAETELWHASMAVSIPDFIKSRKFTSVNDLVEMISEETSYDIVIVPAALSDYAPKRQEGKISSDEEEITLTLTKLPKVLPKLRKSAKFLAGFKAESTGDLIKKAEARMNEYSLDMIVANNIHDVSEKETKSIIIFKDKRETFTGSKAELAEKIIEGIAEHME